MSCQRELVGPQTAQIGVGHIIVPLLWIITKRKNKTLVVLLQYLYCRLFLEQ